MLPIPANSSFICEKWKPTGALQWRLFAGTSLDSAGLDPNNDTEVYSKYHHYSLDYSKSISGTEWTLKEFTVDRFKYPNDPRIDQNSNVGSRALGAGAWRIGGKLFVGRSSQEGYRFELYRQEMATDGEVLVPSFRMGAGGDPITFSITADHAFIGYGLGHVRILNKADGKPVGSLRQNVNGWKGSDGQVDAAYGMTVTLRKNGEYIVLFENAPDTVGPWRGIVMVLQSSRACF